MNIKHKLSEYVKDMHIPSADRVLPEGMKQVEERQKNVHQRRYYIGMAGTAIACAAAATVMIWQPWQDTDSFDNMQNMAMGTPENDMFTGDGENNGIDHTAGSSGSDEYIVDRNDHTEVPAVNDAPLVNSPYGDGVIGDGNAPSEIGDWSGEGEPIAKEDYADALAPAPGEELEGCFEDVIPGQQLQAGVLTGGEIRDLKNWDNWLRGLSDGYMEKWSMVLKQRVSVYVHYGDTPLGNIHVRLLQDETVLYEAVTDIEGNAYLFYQYAADSEEKPTGIQIQAADGSWLSYDYSQNYADNQVLDVELEQENQAVRVDLMYVIDTTGSMGDELEYLKAEIQDVIERAAEQTGAEIRTSVNFYRDEGDEYVVKYYDFRDDAKEVAALVGEQSANGGGDEPEAVHTALDNALHQHSWSEDSTVKLMFLVLDAPPHDDDEVKKQLLSLTEEAAAMGVRIIPVAASGASEDTQQLLRSMAIMTGGTFIFLDDNSGVGYGHTVTVKPEEYSSEYLNEMMIRIIGEYCGVDIAAQEIEKPTEIETTEFRQ